LDEKEEDPEQDLEWDRDPQGQIITDPSGYGTPLSTLGSRSGLSFIWLGPDPGRIKKMPVSHRPGALSFSLGDPYLV